MNWNSFTNKEEDEPVYIFFPLPLHLIIKAKAFKDKWQEKGGWNAFWG